MNDTTVSIHVCSRNCRCGYTYHLNWRYIPWPHSDIADDLKIFPFFICFIFNFIIGRCALIGDCFEAGNEVKFGMCD